MSDSGSTKPTALQRGQMRRRLRHQQRIREALLLDLGALVFELHRQGRREPELLQAKAAEVSAVDNEVRALAEALEADATLHMLSPGVSGTCANCGGLLSTEDRFCPHCGTPSDPSLAGEEPVDEPQIDSSGNGTGERSLDKGESPDSQPRPSMEQTAATKAEPARDAKGKAQASCPHCGEPAERDQLV